MEAPLQKVWLQVEAEGTCPSAGADRPLLLCSHVLNPICLFALIWFRVGRLPASGQARSAWELCKISEGRSREA